MYTCDSHVYTCMLSVIINYKVHHFLYLDTYLSYNYCYITCGHTYTSMYYNSTHSNK